MASTILRGVAIALPVGLALNIGVATPAFAQDYTAGAITGTVQDASGNPIAGATVTIKSLAQGFTRSMSSSSNGGFYFASLPPGTYEITTEAGGYKTDTLPNARVVASKSATFSVVLASAAATETVVVTGTRQVFDFTNTTTGLTLDIAEISKEQPISHDIQSLIQLSPGAVENVGALRWGDLTAIAGASVAENAYYINGLNITNFDTYLGGSTVPYYFYTSVDTWTGGYSPEYGRATGGIVNAVTKSGSNDFMAAVHLDWSPDALRSTSPNTYRTYNEGHVENELTTALEVSGPIIKDHLFAYGLMELRNNTNTVDSISAQAQLTDRDNSPFYGFKIDGYINPDHHLEFTWFQTSDTTYESQKDFDPSTFTVGQSNGAAPTQYITGGQSWVAKYTGHFFDWLTFSAAYGINYDRNVTVPGVTSNLVIDQTAAGDFCGATDAYCTAQTNEDVAFPYNTKRKFWRMDADIYFNAFGDHHVRVGIDNEFDTLQHNEVRTGPDAGPKGGGFAYLFHNCYSGGVYDNPCEDASNNPLPGVTTSTDYVELNYFNTGGAFKTVNGAYYFQDQWKVLDTGLTLNLGVRLDQFRNYTGDGTRYVNFQHLWAPRVGFSYVPPFDDSGRFYGSYGTYYLPIAANTAFREASTSYYFQEYWITSGMSNGLPTLDSQLTNWNGATECPFGLTPGSVGSTTPACAVTSNGTTPDPTSALARNLAATQENEIKIGYERQFDVDPDHFYGGSWTVGIVYTNRELVETADDTDLDPVIDAWCTAHGISGCASHGYWTGFSQYTVVNPGSDAKVVLGFPLPGGDADCTAGGGTPLSSGLCEVNFTAAQLGLPKAKRNYDSIELKWSRAFDGVWGFNGSYTWSRLKGNTEGYVISDRGTAGQTDAGITEDWDLPEFEVGAYGYLPNAREHVITLGGEWAPIKDALLGAHALIASPYHESCYGWPANYTSFVNGHPIAYYYGQATNACGGVVVPRGTAQETDWEYQIDMSARYAIDIPSGQHVTLRADVFNIFNLHAVTAHQTIGELTPGVLDNPHYGLPLAYQTPRTVRLGLDINF